MPQIDKTSYNKSSVHPPGHGYEARKGAPTSIVVHSTSNPNAKNTQFAAEAKFLLNHRLASAHYLVGKDGRIVEFLDPRRWAAWHAGNAQVAYTNERSIGVELHHSVGDPPYPSAQLQALAELLVSLCAEFNIPFGMIETHGQVAIKGPYIRKSDPSDWSHRDFLTFRSQLQIYNPARYRVKRIMISQRQQGGPPYAGELQPGDVVEIDVLYPNGMAHLRDERGFVPIADVEPFGKGVL